MTKAEREEKRKLTRQRLQREARRARRLRTFITSLLLVVLTGIFLSLLGVFPGVNQWYRGTFWFYTNSQLVGEFQGRTADPILGDLEPAHPCKDSSDCKGRLCLYTADEVSPFRNLSCHRNRTCSGFCDPLGKSPGVRRIVRGGTLAVSSVRR